MAKVSGPLFDGRADKAADDLADELEKEVGRRTYALVQANLRATLRNPTGRYQSRVQVRQFGDAVRVSDQDIIYGSWLEGTGSRNDTTRFKGYSNWRRTKNQIESEVGSISRKILPTYLRRMQ
jgi:hypothetical protein